MDDLTRRDFLRLLGTTGIGALSASGLLSGYGAPGFAGVGRYREICKCWR